MGDNWWGALGTGDYEPSSAAAKPVYGLSDVTAVSSGANLALTTDGRVWAWGTNFDEALGEVEGTAPGYSTTPLRLRAPVGVREIEGGFNTGFALK